MGTVRIEANELGLFDPDRASALEETLEALAEASRGSFRAWVISDGESFIVRLEGRTPWQTPWLGEMQFRADAGIEEVRQRAEATIHYWEQTGDLASPGSVIPFPSLRTAAR